MIKAGGIWVSPAEVEAVLIEHPDVLEAAVVGARDASRAGDDGRLRRRPPGPHDRRRRRSTPTAATRMAAFKRPRAGRRRRRAAEDGDRQDPALRPARPPRRERGRRRSPRSVVQPSTVDGTVLETRTCRRRRTRRSCSSTRGSGASSCGAAFPAALHAATGRRARSSTPAPATAAAGRPRCRGRSTYMHHEADVVLPALLAALGIERPRARRPQRRGVDRPAPRRRRARRRRARAAGAARVRRGRHGGVDRRRPRRLRRRPTCASASARYHDDVDATFRGWNDVWLSPAFRRGTSPTACRRSRRRCS